MILYIKKALVESEFRKRETFISSKKNSADGLLHDLEGKPDVDRVVCAAFFISKELKLKEQDQGFGQVHKFKLKKPTYIINSQICASI